jgi:hypothetical protein
MPYKHTFMKSLKILLFFACLSKTFINKLKILSSMGSTYFKKRLFATKRKPKYGRGRAARPKTFASEEAAKKWAEANKLKDYTLVDLKEGRNKNKIRVVPKK